MKHNFPSEIYIGKKTYEVRKARHIRDDTGSKKMGDVRYHRCTIRLNTKYERILPRVFMHEVIHAILFEAGQKAHNNEYLVHALENGFTDFILDNPKAIEYIRSCYAHKD